MIYDGECLFCRRWIARWQEITGDRIEYRASQEVAAEHPAIGPEDFAREVKLIEPDGRVSGGAEAVFRALASRPGTNPYRAIKWCYENIVVFRRLTEVIYAWVARHRGPASTLTRWLWGENVRRPTYSIACRWYLRLLAAVYLCAFWSLRVQVDGLIGPTGILPFDQLLSAVRAQLGSASGFLYLPTLCWITGASTGALDALCDAGVVFALLLLVEVAPAVCLVLLWVCYLSLVTAGQTFLGFQWDLLLLEAGLLSLFVAPLSFRPAWLRGRHALTAPPSNVGLFLLRWLLFRLMLMSGVVKLTSGDQAWRDLSALRYHYETQPLPTWVGWYAHQLPPTFQAWSVGFVYVVEIAAPWLIFGPRRVRSLACILLLTLQLLIAATGNYGFFNLLTATFCVLLIDDRQWPSWLRGRAEASTTWPVGSKRTALRWSRWILAPVAAVYLLYGSLLLWQAFDPDASWPAPLEVAYRAIEPFRSLNGYGLFRVMTRERPEIILEGSNDGQRWLEYSFRWKPGDVDRAPGFVAPYQPRLDWQMWFAALGTYRDNPWFLQLMSRLLQGSAPVTHLLATNPFPDAPPRYVRAVLYDYRFTDLETRRRTGAWWKRARRGLYCPELSLRATEEP
jgi:predicted DCC family thiol-disulfide oxidoreductase YuxK